MSRKIFVNLSRTNVFMIIAQLAFTGQAMIAYSAMAALIPAINSSYVSYAGNSG